MSKILLDFTIRCEYCGRTRPGKLESGIPSGGISASCLQCGRETPFILTVTVAKEGADGP